MSEIYDNWERLVRSTIRREDLKISGQRTPSDLSLASSSSLSSPSSSLSSSSSPILKLPSFNFFELLPSVINFQQVKGAIKSFYLERIRREEAIELYPGGVFNFRYKKIKAAANNFGCQNKLGESDFGAVYKGVLPDGTQIAVKLLAAKSKKWAREMLNEISGTVYAVQHPNIVKMMACCAKQNKVLLVYEFMENNTLEHALFGSEQVKSRLDWLTRIKICRDVAKGLAFLHQESRVKIIHRNVKPANILLGKDFTAKISNFEFSQLNEEENTDHITQLAGTMEYMAPEYMLGFLTTKADVYSFGIVVLETISGKNVFTYEPKFRTFHYLDKAYECQQQGNLIALIDASLGSDYTYNEALTILNLAMQCVNPSPKLRPSMSEVVKVLDRIVKVVELKIKPKTKYASNLLSANE